MSSYSQGPDEHPFLRHPHRTLVALSFPVLLSLTAEPLTGLADTAFVRLLGAPELAALGAATSFLSGIFWIFFFLGVGTQTEVARAAGAGEQTRARQTTDVALLLAVVLGILMAAGLWPLLPRAAEWMGSGGVLREPTLDYLRIRLLGGPATLVLMAAFGALRGLQDMRTPLWIAVTINALNIVLDPLLIWGVGPVPALGIRGAAWASTASQWTGALWGFLVLRRRLRLSCELRWSIVRRLTTVGRDMVIRTAALTLFLVLATRSATQCGAEAGAAHQAVRIVWVFTALLLDAYAHTAQSLVGYFLGAGLVTFARRAARISVLWSAGTGVALSIVLLLSENLAENALVPVAAQGLFGTPWRISALFQPVNAVSFITDGIHWGTGDYRYLRNATVAAALVGIPCLELVSTADPGGLVKIWLVIGIWIALRAAFGLARLWPGVGAAPLSGSEARRTTTGENHGPRRS